MSKAENLTETIEWFVKAMVHYEKDTNYEYRSTRELDAARDAMQKAIEELQRD